jgi:hypothetical protein
MNSVYSLVKSAPYYGALSRILLSVPRKSLALTVVVAVIMARRNAILIKLCIRCYLKVCIKK